MPEVFTTKGYEKYRDSLLNRGKIGKDAYKQARVAEAEARQGKLRTVPRTHHGENRIPNGEKYDLPGDYRLVVQRVNLKGVEGRVFLFVGSHDGTEQWLENNRGLVWQPENTSNRPPNSEQLQKEKERLQQLLNRSEVERKELSEIVEKIKLENSMLGQMKQSQDTHLTKLAQEIQELEGKDRSLEAEKQQILKARDHLAAEQQRLSNERKKLQREVAQESEKNLTDQIEELKGKERSLEAERQELTKARDQLAAEQRRLSNEKVDLDKKLHERTEQLRQALNKAKNLEKENGSLLERLRQWELEEGSTRTYPINQMTWLGVIIGVLMLVGLVSIMAIVFAIKGCAGPPLPPTSPLLHTGAPATTLAQPHTALPVISPLDVAKFENKECSVEFIIKSKYDRFDWGLLLNSEDDFRNAKNFTVVIDKQTAGEKYKQIGVANLGDYFKVGTGILVTGKIEKHQDKRSDREEFQIRVKDPEQIKLR